MDGFAFDALTRTLTTAGSRRRALTGLVSGTLGLALGASFIEDAAAKKKKPCPPCKKRKKGKCKPKSAGTPCKAFAGGVCQNGACINLQGDETNCGALGTTCGPTQVCQAGSCFPVSICSASTTELCPGGAAVACGPSCACDRSTEGNVVCVSSSGLSCATLTPCTSSATCGAGSACVAIGPSCCAEGPAHACLARCPVPTA